MATLATGTVCYSTDGITAACGKRKKRSGSLMLDNPLDGYTYHLDSGSVFPPISPSKTTATLSTKKGKREAERNDKSLALSKLEELNQIANVRTSKKTDELARADPRFFLFYWYTSTVTSTTTSFSATTTITLT